MDQYFPDTKIRSINLKMVSSDYISQKLLFRWNDKIKYNGYSSKNVEQSMK